MEKKKRQKTQNPYIALDTALSDWLDDLARIPSCLMPWGDLSKYYPSDDLCKIEQDLQANYDKIKKKQGDAYRRFKEDENCKKFVENIRAKRVEAMLHKKYKRKHGDYTLHDREFIKKVERLRDIPWLRSCIYEVADIYARYGALDYIRPHLERYLPEKRPRGAPRDTLRKRMLKKVFLGVYEAFTGKKFGWYPLALSNGKSSRKMKADYFLKPHRKPLRYVLVQGYLPAIVKIFELLGERVSQAAIEKIRNELRADLITGPAKSSGLEPVRIFYQSSATKEEKSFLVEWVLTIGLYRHRKSAIRFLETPVTPIVR